MSNPGRLARISVLHINLRGSRAAAVQLVQYVSQRNVEVILVQVSTLRIARYQVFQLVGLFPQVGTTRVQL